MGRAWSSSSAVMRAPAGRICRLAIGPNENLTKLADTVLRLARVDRTTGVRATVRS